MGRFRVAVEEEDETDAGGGCPVIAASPWTLDHRNHAAMQQQQQQQIMYDHYCDSHGRCPPPTAAFGFYEQKPRGFFSRNWALLLSACIVLLAYACRHYLPPAPPSSSILLAVDKDDDDDDDAAEEEQQPSWSLYLQQHGDTLFQASKALFIETPYHVGSWWISNAWTELQVRWKRSIAEEDSAAPCDWRPQPHLRADLERSIQGQPAAVELLSDAVLAWDRKEPLIVLAHGFPSTGKRSLALALVQSLVDNDDDDDTVSSSCSATSTVLHIQGWEYTTQSQYYRLLRRIQYHCSSQQQHRRHHGGAAMLLLWTHVDQSAPLIVQQVLTHVQTAPAACPTMIVYMTTSTGEGMTVIADALRSGSFPPSPMEFQERQSRRTTPASATANDDHDIMRSSSVSLHLPFRPHTVASLTAMVRAHCAVTDAALEQILAPVTYLEWRRSDGGGGEGDDESVILTMAVDGARAVPLTKLRRWHTSTSTTPATTPTMGRSTTNVMLHARGEAASADCTIEEGCVPVVWDE